MHGGHPSQAQRFANNRPLVVMLAIAALLAPFFADTPDAGAAPCAGANSPVVQEIVVTQGAGTNAFIVPGKEAVAHALITDACDGGPVRLNSARLSVKGQTLTPMRFTPGNATACCTALPAAPTNPLFQIPASLVTSGLSSVTLTLNWTSGSTTTETQHAGAVPVVASSVQPLRVLVVPMVDGLDPDTLLQAGDIQMLERRMSEVGRLFPVSNGLAELGGTAGFQWHLATGPLDLRKAGALQADGDFCGSGGNWFRIMPGLEAQLLAWNSPGQNADRVADRVLGVYAGRMRSSSPNCSEGMAAYPGLVSWAELGTQKWASSVFAQELGHNFQLSPPTSGGHSHNSQADPRDLAYNVVDARYVPGARPVMGIVNPIVDGEAFLEPTDWSWAYCALNFGSSCSSARPRRGLPAASQYVFHVVGQAGATSATSDIASHFNDGTATTAEQTDSPYVLAYRRGAIGAPGEVLRTYRIPYSNEYINHQEGHDALTSPTAELAGAFPFPKAGNDRPTLVQVWRGQPGVAGSTLLHEASPTTLAVNRIDVVTNNWDVAPLVDDPGAQFDPTVTPDGQTIVYVEKGVTCDALVAVTSEGAEIDRYTATPCAPSPLTGAEPRITHPSTSPAGDRVAFTCQSGDVCVVSFSSEAGFGQVSQVYACERRAGACLSTSENPLAEGASGVTWDPTGSWLAVSVGGDLFTIRPNSGVTAGDDLLELNLATQLTETAVAEVEPSVSPDGREIVYRVTAADALHVLPVTPNGGRGAGADRPLGVNGFDPSWHQGLIAFSSAGEGGVGQVTTVNVSTGQTRTITVGQEPALATAVGGALVATRGVGVGRDIVYGAPNGRVDITAIGTASDPAQVEGYLYASHEGALSPIASRLPVTSHGGGTVSFTLTDFEASLAPQFAVAAAGLSDGYHFVVDSPPNTPAIDLENKEPTAAIVQPRGPGALPEADPVRRFADTEPVPVEAVAWDVEGRQLGAAKGENFLTGPAGSGVTNYRIGSDASYRLVRPSDVTVNGTPLRAWPIGVWTVTSRFEIGTGDDRQIATDVTTFVVDRVTFTADFDPEEIHFTGDDDGDSITDHVVKLSAAAYPSMTALDLTDVRITSVGDRPVAGLPYDYTAKTAVGVGTVRLTFDRKAVNKAIKAYREASGIKSGYVEIVVEGKVRGRAFRVADPAAPRFFSY